MPQDGIYRAILWIMAATAVAGAIFAILGETIAQNPIMVRVGTGISLVAGASNGFFRWLGTKEIRRRAAAGDKDAAGQNTKDPQ